jgi:hypothetical protein
LPLPLPLPLLLLLSRFKRPGGGVQEVIRDTDTPQWVHLQWSRGNIIAVVILDADGIGSERRRAFPLVAVAEGGLELLESATASTLYHIWNECATGKW